MFVSRARYEQACRERDKALKDAASIAEAAMQLQAAYFELRNGMDELRKLVAPEQMGKALDVSRKAGRASVTSDTLNNIIKFPGA